MEWRPVDFAPGYLVSADGRLKNKCGRLLAGTRTSTGYCAVVLAAPSGRRQCLMHRLVAMAWIPNPDKKTIVNHINGIRDDNHVPNLEWVTSREHNLKKVFHAGESPGAWRAVLQLDLAGELIQEWAGISVASRALDAADSSIVACCRGRNPTAGGFKWQYVEIPELLEGEEWKALEDCASVIAISSLGRARLKTGRITKGSEATEYNMVAGFRVHRLVAAAFCPKPEGCDVVNHLDGDKRNNAASNLEWTTPRGDVLRARTTGLRGKEANNGRAVVRVDAEGVETVYPSIEEASRDSDRPAANIGKVCTGERKHAGPYTWYFRDTGPVVIEAPPRGSCVIRVCPDGTTTQYSSVYAAAKDNDLPAPNIAKVCRGERKHAGGYAWYFQDTGPVVKVAPPRGRPVVRTSTDGTETQYPSIYVAAKDNDISTANITKVCQGERKSAGGFGWKLSPESEALEVTVAEPEVHPRTELCLSDCEIDDLLGLSESIPAHETEALIDELIGGDAS
jgi:hypothetical protein